MIKALLLSKKKEFKKLETIRIFSEAEDKGKHFLLVQKQWELFGLRFQLF